MTAPLTGMNDNGHSNNSPQESKAGGLEGMQVFVCVLEGVGEEVTAQTVLIPSAIPPHRPTVVP